MATHEAVSTARNLINEILGVPPESVTREVELGSSLSFAAVAQDVALLRQFLAAISDEVLGRQGEPYVRDFANACATALQAMHRLSDFTVENAANPQNERDQRQQRFKEYASQVMSNFRPLYLESLMQRADPNQISSAIASAISASLAPYMPKLEAIDSLANDLYQQKALAAETIGKLQASAAATGVSRYRAIFDDEAKAYSAQARPWLLAAIGVTIATVAIAACLSLVGLAPDLIGIAPVNLLQLSLTKIILVGLGMSAAIWCGSNYRALRHLAVVDKHRANALATYEVFAAATSDPQERGLILTQSAQAIFGHAATGYLGKDGGGHPDSAPQVLQIARDVGRIVTSDKP